MTIAYTIVHPTTGVVLRSGHANTIEQAQLQNSDNIGVLSLVEINPETQRVNPVTEVVEARPTSVITINKTTLTANGTDFVSISSIPASNTVRVTVPEGQGVDAIAPFTVADGVLEITTTVAGNYIVEIENQPNQNFKVSIDAA